MGLDLLIFQKVFESYLNNKKPFLCPQMNLGKQTSDISGETIHDYL